MRFAFREAVGVLMSLVGLVFVTLALRGRPRHAADAAIAGYRSGLSRFDTALVRLDSMLARGDEGSARRAFRHARTAFKRVELFVEYHGHFAARDVNGPPLPHAEDEDPENPLPPTGLQVIEADLFPRMNTSRLPADRREITLIRDAVSRLSAAGADTLPGDAFLFDAMRQELARVATLGIAGFDVTTSRDAMSESADAIDGIARAFAPYRDRLAKVDRAALDSLDRRFASAIGYLRAHSDFDRFDRLEFIARYAQPLARALASAKGALGVGAPLLPRAWSADASSIYDRNAFDAMFFAAIDAPRPTPELIALGRDLFFDARLSQSGDRSCGSCHIPARAFTDRLPRATLIAGHVARGGGRNTPTLLNAALQPSLFDDARVSTLEDQVTDVLGSPGEMGGSLDRAARLLDRDTFYVDRFAQAFSLPRDRAVQSRTVRLALAAYVRSLVALSSRFDRAVRGELEVLTATERLGFNLFMGKARCATCHFAPLFNGALPPMLTESEPEVIGVPATSTPPRAVIDPDSGRFNVRRIDLHLFAFKTPTLRNVELTAPYMHNGVFRTLDEVVDFYDGGGGHGRGIRVTQTLPADSLRLSHEEQRALVAFMRALTDTAGTTSFSPRSTVAAKRFEK